MSEENGETSKSIAMKQEAHSLLVGSSREKELHLQPAFSVVFIEPELLPDEQHQKAGFVGCSGGRVLYRASESSMKVGLHMSAQKKAMVIKVDGRVQRTGYRRFVLDTAQEIGISGYVKNERDGSVTIFAQGGDKQLEAFLERVRAPPEPMIVRSFIEKAGRINPRLKFFEIEFGPLAMELQEGFGAMGSEFRDYRQEFRGFVGEFRDYRQEFRGFVGEFRDYRQEFRDFAQRTDQNFKVLMDKYGEISDKLTQVLETLQRESMETRKELTRAIDTLSDLVRKFMAGAASSPAQ
jgi:acylphosphatase